MKKIFTIFLLIIISFWISLPTWAMVGVNLSNILIHKYNGIDYSINLDYNFFLKESIFEKYEADITYQSQTYTILYISIEKNYLYEKDNYLVETYILNENQIFYFRDFISKECFNNLKINDCPSQELIEKNIDILHNIRMEYLDNKIISSSSIEVETIPKVSPYFDIIKDPIGGETLVEQSERLASTDSYLDSYDPYKDIKYDTNTGRYLENSIINIIPKAYFFKTGTYSFIGKEYGYFINTISKTGGTYDSDVVLFDIDYERLLTNNSPTNADFIVSIQPLFSAKYISYEKINSSYDNATWNKLFGSLSSIVLRDSYVYNYFLTDIEMTLNLKNSTGLNQGDFGYNPLLDKGDIVTYSKFEIYKTNNVNKLAIDAISLFLGMIPNVGNLTSAIFALLDLNNTVNNNKSVINSEYEDTSIIVETLADRISLEYLFASTKDKQYEFYGMLYKSSRLCTSTKVGVGNVTLSNNMNKILVKYDRQFNSKLVANYRVSGPDIYADRINTDYYFDLSLNLYSNNNFISSANKKTFMGTYKRF